jgi:hypothetical protein
LTGARHGGIRWSEINLIRRRCQPCASISESILTVPPSRRVTEDT